MACWGCRKGNRVDTDIVPEGVRDWDGQWWSHLVDLLRTPEQRVKEALPIVGVAFSGSWGNSQRGVILVWLASRGGLGCSE